MLKYAVVLIILFAGCQEQTESPIKIFVAASAKNRIENIAKEYKNADIEIYSTSSGKGYAQLLHGFKFDIFFSADDKYPQKIYEAGLSEKPVVYMKGELVIYSKLAEITVDMLPKYQPIAIANPKLAPYGSAAQEALKGLNLKYVFGENVAQAVNLVDSGAAKAGVVAKSLVENRKYVYPVPKEMYTPISQAFVITKYGSNRDEVRAFVKFLLERLGK